MNAHWQICAIQTYLWNHNRQTLLSVIILVDTAVCPPQKWGLRLCPSNPKARIHLFTLEVAGEEVGARKNQRKVRHKHRTVQKSVLKGSITRPNQEVLA